MRYLILLLLAAPVCAQDFRPVAWQLTGRIDTREQVFVRRAVGDTVAVEIYERNPLRLIRIDVNASGECYWAMPDDDGHIEWRESQWEETPCRDFDYSARLFDDGATNLRDVERNMVFR